MVITCFAILTFSSPPSVGERISLAIESFLSLSFLCMMVADNIPINSDVSPLITNYLIICMTLISLALFLNTVSMNMSGNRPVPRWLHTLAFIYIGPLVGHCGKPSEKAKSFGRFFSSRVPENVECKVRLVVNKVCTELSAKKLYYGEKLLKYLCVTKDTREVSNRRSEFRETKRHMRQILSRSARLSEQKFTRDFWRCVAQTVDRVCVISFSTSFICVSAAMLMKGYGHKPDTD